MVRSYYTAKVEAGLSRIKHAVDSSAWASAELSCYLEEMALGLGDCMVAFERRIMELEREVRREQPPR